MHTCRKDWISGGLEKDLDVEEKPRPVSGKVRQSDLYYSAEKPAVLWAYFMLRLALLSSPSSNAYLQTVAAAPEGSVVKTTQVDPLTSLLSSETLTRLLKVYFSLRCRPSKLFISSHLGMLYFIGGAVAEYVTEVLCFRFM